MKIRVINKDINQEQFNKYSPIIATIVFNECEDLKIDEKLTIYLKDNIRQLIQQVVKSSPFEVVTLKSPLSNKEIVKVYTPEEKFIVADVLRAILPTLELYKT
jgi:uracil phosphoribosyltransferase